MIPVGTAVGYLTLDYTQFSSNLKTAIGEATSLSGKFSDTMGKGLTTVGNQIASVGKTMTTGLTVPIGTAAASAVKFGSEFDKQMSTVQAVSNATTEDLNAMRDAANNANGAGMGFMGMNMAMNAGANAQGFYGMQSQQTQTQAPTGEVRYCKYCGKQITADSRFCPYCGKEQ